MKMAPYISFGLEAVDKMTAEELEIAAGEQLPVEEPLDADILEQLMEE
jgi:hypothetical protein